MYREEATMAAQGEHPSRPHPHLGEKAGNPRLNLRVAPEAVIIVTEHNRIVLVDNPFWNMEDFNRREVVEIVLPEGFRATDPRSAGSTHDPLDLPVELVVGRSTQSPPSLSISKDKAPDDAWAAGDFAIGTGLIQSAQDAIVVLRRDGSILAWNSGAHRMYGFAADEVLGKPYSLLIPYELRTAEERHRNKVLAGEFISPFDTSRTRNDGAKVAVCVSISPVLNEAREIVGTLEIGRDISARKEEERALAAQLASLTQSNKELEDYAIVVAHDLQAPLNLVASHFAELSKKSAAPLDDDTSNLLKSASAALPRMQKLIKDLLELARLEGRPPERVRTDCAAMVAAVLANLDLIIKKSGATVLLGALPVVLADPTQLGQVFQNLISNAIKFRSDRPPEVRISAELRPGEWRFSISDNGIGIEPAMIPRLFQPLQRLQPKAPQPGSGLGLAIAKKIMTRHGGRIWAEAKPGLGSTFYFTLPATESKDSTETV